MSAALAVSGRILAAPAAIPVLAVLAAFAVGLLLIVATGASLGQAISAFSQGAFGSAYAISVSLNRATVYALVGIGFVIAARAGLTNVGGEGQIAMGGIMATAVAVHGGVAGLPLGLAVILPVLAASLAGGLWGGLAGVLKVRAGTNEVISTLLLSFIAIWIVYWCVQSTDLLRQPMTSAATLPESATVPASTMVPLLTGSYAAPVTVGVVIALILAVVAAVLLARSVFGFRLRFVGLNPIAAARAGIPVERMTVLALFIAGALGGLAGAIMLLGEQHSLKTGFSSGYGFDGLVVGLLARGRISGVIAGALLFGFLRSGGITMEMAAGVPTALVQIVQGLIVISIAGAAYWMDRRASR
ncbi:ABC transporter permease [Minwuia thermotolerans]|uniref:ABC transporter permease n=1 Tax=Minwuia thermotolerans TaxID=2056226 RepID=A0A2M9G3D0_9PROT|nr:ABC transporter permease [Minwuia thermotolerans]PJK30215.1 ABC transporter permease [Minwuia thermotolerans]